MSKTAITSASPARHKHSSQRRLRTLAGLPLLLILLVLGAPSLGVARAASTAPAVAGIASEPSTDDVSAASLDCWRDRPLSAVGLAMNAIVPKQGSTCAGFPSPWLYPISPGGAANYAAAVRTELLKTKHRFSYSSLFFQQVYHFDDALLALHEQIAKTLPGRTLPLVDRPIIRFMYGRSGALEIPNVGPIY